LSGLFDAKTNFAGATAYDAIAQGYLYFMQHGTEGQPDCGTTVCIDRNGLRPDLIGAHDPAVVDASGKAAGQLLGRHFVV